MGKPKILCLHGGGTNPDIHQFQSRKLNILIDRQYELVTPKGIIDCGAGPGMLPFFEGSDFAQWLWDGKGNEEWNNNHEVEHEEWADLPQLVDIYHKQGPFEGIIAFSQGAKVGMHLVKWLQENEPDDGLKYIVLVCCTSPFRGKRQPGEPGVPAEGSIKIPSFHLIAEKDEWHNQGEIVARCFKNPVVVRSQEGHQMPMDNGLNRKIVEFVKEKGAA
ncbi:hypothetical protein N0V93_002294 [Gnomoniopsis smithogilvyi]|uniref:Serine hydrolase domain-containing protein n=1 Tax=Gnomoniopsis smithogilvyi TaxID=1191159 RepID=A0A9W9CYV8_9PEZI|nr:hypothetical protein N0V93_002294 [Gnomoniopsis smithogilvyi]